MYIILGFPGGSDGKKKKKKSAYSAGDLVRRCLGWKEPLEEEMATHSSIPSWRIPRTEEPGGLQSGGSQRVRDDRTRTHWQTYIHTFYN